MSSRHIRRGEGIDRMSAQVYNFAADQYSDSLGTSPKGFPVGFSRQLTTIVVQNNTNADLDRYSIVGLGSPLVDPAVDLAGFQARYRLEAVQITASNLYQWGVLPEPIAQGDYGLATISGVTTVQINGTGAFTPFAMPSDNAQYLVPAKCGICRVLWMQQTTGVAWALVNIG